MPGDRMKIKEPVKCANCGEPIIDLEHTCKRSIESLEREINRLKAELDGVWYQEQRGVVLIRELRRENESLKAELKAMKEIADRFMWQVADEKKRVKELEDKFGLKCDHCGGEIEKFEQGLYRCVKCEGIGRINKPSISIGMIPMKNG